MKPTLFRRDSFRRFRIELAQARHDFLREEHDVRDRIFMVQETALAKHQQMAKAADVVAECLYLIVHVVWCAGKAGAALDQLLDRRGGLFDRIAMPISDEAAALATRFQYRDVGRA